MSGTPRKYVMLLLIGFSLGGFCLALAYEYKDNHTPEGTLLGLGSNVIKTYTMKLDTHRLHIVEFMSDRDDYCVAASSSNGSSVSISCLPKDN
jgi:hypothetical protein